MDVGWLGRFRWVCWGFECVIILLDLMIVRWLVFRWMVLMVLCVCSSIKFVL